MPADPKTTARPLHCAACGRPLTPDRPGKLQSGWTLHLDCCPPKTPKVPPGEWMSGYRAGLERGAEIARTSPRAEDLIRHELAEAVIRGSVALRGTAPMGCENGE